MAAMIGRYQCDDWYISQSRDWYISVINVLIPMPNSADKKKMLF